MSATISSEVFSFLNELDQNNNREWFNANKEGFTKIQTEIKTFYGELLTELAAHDEIAKQKLFRIYRDVRFSKDKTPYKTHLGGSYSRAGAHLRGGYYLHLKPGDSFVATGFWEPNKEDLFRIRKEFELDTTEIKGIIEAPKFKKTWGAIVGDSLKTAPKGFDKTHANIEMIRMKQFIFTKKFSDKEVLSKNFLKDVNETFKTIRPYFDYMSDVLTTNLNGESILD